MLYVFKQIIAVFIGIGIGFSSLMGMTAMGTYALASFGISWIYVQKVLQPE